MIDLDDWDLDRKFLNLSANMSNVFSWTYGMLGGRLIAPIDPDKFDNASSKLKEVGIRTLIVVGALAGFFFAGTYLLLGAVVLSAGSKVCRAIGYHFQKNGYTPIHTEAKEKEIIDGQARVMVWNIRGHGGGLHYSEAGVIHWRDRIDRIMESILDVDPDVLVLQEIIDTTLIEEIVSRLKDEYPHFYTHLGVNVWGNESGVMVITKNPVSKFTHFDFVKTDEKTKRGFGLLEIKASPESEKPILRVIATQLSPGEDCQDLRMDQVAQIVDRMAREKLAMPTLFVGSLNIDRDNSEEGQFLASYVHHSYLDTEPTHSNALLGQWKDINEQESFNDFISVFKTKPSGDCRKFATVEKGVRLIDSRIVKGFEENNTKTARSDHHAVVTEVAGLTR